MPTLLSTTPTYTTTGSELHTVITDYLPLLALTAGLIAAILLACAIIYLIAGIIAYTTFLTVRRVTATCAQHLRCPHSVEYAQLVTVHPDGAATKVANLDRYRHRRRQQHNHPNTPPTTDPSPDDAPA